MCVRVISISISISTSTSVSVSKFINSRIYMHACMHAHARARAHAHTHTHTIMCKTLFSSRASGNPISLYMYRAGAESATEINRRWRLGA